MLDLTPLPFLLYHTIVIMLDRLIYWVDLSGFASEGFLSCLSKRCIFVASLKFRSSSTSLAYGVTYGLYCLYYVCSLFNTFSTLLGCYAMQVTVSCISLSSKIFLSYRYSKSSWMLDNFLQPNEEKTGVLVCALDKFMFEVMEDYIFGCLSSVSMLVLTHNATVLPSAKLWSCDHYTVPQTNFTARFIAHLHSL